jgi:hypothetical protein
VAEECGYLSIANPNCGSAFGWNADSASGPYERLTQSWSQCKMSRTKLVDIPANLASLEFLLRYHSHLIFQARLHCTEEHRELYETTSNKITRAQRLTTCGKTLVAIEVNPGNRVGTGYLVIYESICGRPDGTGHRVVDRSSNFQILVGLFVALAAAASNGGAESRCGDTCSVMWSFRRAGKWNQAMYCGRY